MKLGGKTVLVIGLKRTGVSVARFIGQHGGRVRVSDRQSKAQLADELATLAELAPDIRLGDEDETLLTGVDLVVPSPGVPYAAPLLRAAVRRGIPVWSEIELAFRFLRCPVLAVTGTNGKSTTTTLLGEFLHKKGERVFVGGNLGTPLLDAVNRHYEVAVVEVSSFQLEWVEQFHPQIGVWLNLTEDHLDRHGTLFAYGQVKRKLFERQQPRAWAVINRDDAAVCEAMQGLPGQVFSFGWSPTEHGAWIDERSQTLILRHDGSETNVSLAQLRLYGRHNLENVMAAVSAALLWKVPIDVVEQTIATFSGLPHRLEFVASKGGVTYFDDSKGTNVGAVLQSLASFTAPVILLAGGVDKGGDYGPLRGPVRTKVKKLILFGEARETIFAALGGETTTVVVDTLADAVREAAGSARTGDVVLLSPACASFDQFRNYAHRGDVFRACVEAL
ncbi:MAG: UDP-N-acetylmuramoyl-L-alanine--D-glutamate ligase [Candidatus Binatia bacterium]